MRRRDPAIRSDAEDRLRHPWSAALADDSTA
jgi:hypothetical protein